MDITGSAKAKEFTEIVKRKETRSTKQSKVLVDCRNDPVLIVIPLPLSSFHKI